MNRCGKFGRTNIDYSLPVLSLAVLLVAAGCAAGPFADQATQERPVKLVLNNSANVTQTFEVWVIDSQASITVRFNDSLTANTTIGPGLSTSSSGEYRYYTAVEPPDSAELHGRFTVEPGEEKHSSIEEFPRDYAVLVVLYQGDKIGWYASANCGNEALVGLEVYTRPSQYGDAGAGYGCR